MSNWNSGDSLPIPFEFRISKLSPEFNNAQTNNRLEKFAMKTITNIALLLGTVLFLGLSATGLADESMTRVSDKDVEKLVKTIEDQQKKFARALDSEVKRSLIRGPAGEIEVAGYLDDLADDIDRLDKRFDGKYSASAEVKALLERADMMNGFIRNHPEIKGANEWDVFGSSLQRLAGAYDTTFPLPNDAMIRRIGDGELEDAATEIGKVAKGMKKPVRKYAKGTDELTAAGESLEEELSSLADSSKTLASRIRSGKPATAEARQLEDTIGRIEALLETPGMPAEVTAPWQESASSVEKVMQAFAME